MADPKVSDRRPDSPREKADVFCRSFRLGSFCLLALNFSGKLPWARSWEEISRTEVSTRVQGRKRSWWPCVIHDDHLDHESVRVRTRK